MEISHQTLLVLARTGDEQSIDILRQVENESERVMKGIKFFYQEGTGVFFSKPKIGRDTILGMPAITPELEAKLLANRNLP